jgi:hypothetical protein
MELLINQVHRVFEGRRVGYVQDKVRPGTGREGALGYERYIAMEHMDKVRPGSGREGSLGCVRRDCVGYHVGNKLPTLRNNQAA